MFYISPGNSDKTTQQKTFHMLKTTNNSSLNFFCLHRGSQSIFSATFYLSGLFRNELCSKRNADIASKNTFLLHYQKNKITSMICKHGITSLWSPRHFWLSFNFWCDCVVFNWPHTCFPWNESRKGTDWFSGSRSQWVGCFISQKLQILSFHFLGF